MLVTSLSGFTDSRAVQKILRAKLFIAVHHPAPEEEEMVKLKTILLNKDNMKRKIYIKMQPASK